MHDNDHILSYDIGWQTAMRVLNFYMDDSATRKPDRVALSFDPKCPNYFALGGVLVFDDEEDRVREAHAALCSKWSIGYPLHSVDIRHAAKAFRWLRRGSSKYEPFMVELTQMLVGIPVLGLACVIDRAGYDARYRSRYGRDQWQLCRTAFSIAVERAAKYARRIRCKLRVFPERSSKGDERRISHYYHELRDRGLPFDAVTSSSYTPLSAADCAATLMDLKFKSKSSPMAQIADLYLWPILWEKYRPGYRPYQSIQSAGRLIECVLEAGDVRTCGSKFSCFELVEASAAAAAAAKVAIAPTPAVEESAPGPTEVLSPAV